MKLILREDVDKLGHLGDVVTVKPGYGRNYLIPQGYAMLATDGNLRAFEQERKKLEARMQDIRNAAMSVAERVNNALIEVRVRVGESGKLYGSVTSKDLEARLAEQGIEVDRKKILLDEAIRALGEYKVDVKLHADVVAELTVQVLREGADETEDAKTLGLVTEEEDVEAPEEVAAEAVEAETAPSPAEEEMAPELAETEMDVAGQSPSV